MEDREMPVYASEATMDGLRATFRYAFDEPQPWKNYLRLAPEVIQGPFQLGDLTIVPVDLPHGKFTTTGFVFYQGDRKLLAYFTDCADVPPAAITAASGVEVLVLDALRDRPHPTHMNFERAIEVSRLITPGNTWFIHLCHEVSHAAKQKELPTGFHLAYDGLKLKVGES